MYDYLSFEISFFQKSDIIWSPGHYPYGYNYLISSKRDWNIIVSLNFFRLQKSGYYNWILVNFIWNITKWLDINVTSSKPRENHMKCAPFANVVEWKIWKRRTLCLNYSWPGSVFAFPRCDCGIWCWIGRPDCSSMSFSLSTELVLHKDQLHQSMCCFCCSIENHSYDSLEGHYDLLWM